MQNPPKKKVLDQAQNPPKKLLDQVRDAIRLKHYSYRTEETYVQWIRRYILFHNKRHPNEMGTPEIEAFLTHLAIDGQVAASTQNQALSAILFLYRHVLQQSLTAALTPSEQNVLLAFPLFYHPKKPAPSFNKLPASIAYYSNSFTAADCVFENVLNSGLKILIFLKTN